MFKKVLVADLIGYEKNAKVHPQTQIDKIKKSIETFGFRGGIKITDDNILIVGHGRVLALSQLDHKEVEVEVIEDLSPEDIRAYRIADNKTAESDWDYALLKDEILDLKEMGYDISNMGFAANEFESIIGDIVDEKNEWVGMPEFVQNDLTANRQIIVSFKNDEDVEEFSKLIDQKLSKKTKSVWFPKVEDEKFMHKKYE